MNSYFGFFVYYCMIPLIWFIGGVGNILGLIVFSREKTKKIGTNQAYKLLFLSDILNMIYIIHFYVYLTTGHSFVEINYIICKSVLYFFYVISNWSPLLLVYVSIEKIVSIKYPAHRFLMRKKEYQISYFILVVLFNLCLNGAVLWAYEIVTFKLYNNSTNQTNIFQTCSFSNSLGQNIVSIINLLNIFIVPFILMISCTTILSFSIVKLRTRIVQNFLNKTQSNERNRFQRDIRLSITSILMNLVYLIFNGPVLIYSIISTNRDLTFWFLINFFFFRNAINFYLILISNHLVRKEVLIL